MISDLPIIIVVKDRCNNQVAGVHGSLANDIEKSYEFIDSELHRKRRDREILTPQFLVFQYTVSNFEMNR